MSYHCGPFWFPDFIKKPLSERFDSACETHDKDYELQIKSKKQADEDLLNNMLKLAEDEDDILLAKKMYKAVRIGGWISWWKNKISIFLSSKKVQ